MPEIRLAVSLCANLLSLGRHGYHGSSASAPVKVITDLKLHLGNPLQHSSDPVVIHPGAVLAMLDLLASVSSDTQPEVLAPPLSALL